MSSTAGEFITETLEYDGGRQVTAYVPAAAAEAVVFAGDGQLIASWGEVLEAADLPPTMIIGAHRVEDETLRLHEYSPGRSTGKSSRVARRLVKITTTLRIRSCHRCGPDHHRASGPTRTRTLGRTDGILPECSVPAAAPCL